MRHEKVLRVQMIAGGAFSCGGQRNRQVEEGAKGGEYAGLSFCICCLLRYVTHMASTEFGGPTCKRKREHHRFAFGLSMISIGLF
jgi:hypothetical protein